MASFSELMGKMAEASDVLTPMEKQQLRDETRAIDEAKNLVKRWVLSGTSTPIFQSPIQTIYSEAISQATSQIDVRVPAGFKHLLIMGTGRCDLVGTADSLLVRFNGDTGSNYARTGFGTDSGSYTNYHVTSDSKCLIGLLPGTTATANANGMIFAYVFHVGLSTFWKSIIATRGIFSGNLAALVDYSTWKNTATIESISLFAGSSNLLAGTEISVYGIL